MVLASTWTEAPQNHGNLVRYAMRLLARCGCQQPPLNCGGDGEKGAMVGTDAVVGFQPRRAIVAGPHSGIGEASAIAPVGAGNTVHA